MKTIDAECPLERGAKNDKRRYSPKNEFVALAFQLHDDTRMFLGLAQWETEGGRQSALNHLGIMSMRIDQARNRLRTLIAK